jgi:transcriptional regulator with XRE-family HTH domain
LEKNLPQKSVADAAGISYNHLGRIELGKSEPGALILARLADALGVPVDTLLDTNASPTAAQPFLAPADLEDISAALKTITTIVERIRRQQPRELPLRAGRRKR